MKGALIVAAGAADGWGFSCSRYEHDSGGEELRAVAWSLGAQGANSETGQETWPVFV